MRRQLIERGWQPQPQRQQRCSVEHQTLCSRYGEASGCYGGQLTICAFVWRRQGTQYRLWATGKSVSDLRYKGHQCEEGCG